MTHEEIVSRIVALRRERRWTEYRFSVETGIPQSTISSWFRKNAQPSVDSLSAICDACGITLSQFFREKDEMNVCMDAEQKSLWEEIASLSDRQKIALAAFISAMKGESD